MKFYIAARVNKKGEVKKIHKMLKDKGHRVLSTWVNEGQIKPYNKYLIKAKTRAIKCIDAIKKSDIFILVSDKTGAGMYTELGIAIASNLSKKKPKIYIVGKYINRSMFFFHPSVRQMKNLDEVLKDV